MKALLLILDGASDEALPELAGRTPLEAARMPHLARLRHYGSSGTMVSSTPGLPLESAVCTLNLLGYEAQYYYPGGRASFEALGQGLRLGPRDMALRCNLVSVTQGDDGLHLTDFTAGDISDERAHALLMPMRPEDPKWELHPGQSYRNLLILRDMHEPSALHTSPNLCCAEPHQHLGALIDPLRPHVAPGQADARYDTLAERLWAWMDNARVATKNGWIMPWVWSPSRPPLLPTFEARYGLRGAVVAGLDFMRGIGIAAGMQVMPAPGANGGPNSHLPAKVQAAINAWDRADFVVVHVNAPDEAAHQQDIQTKIAALERADRQVLGPLLAHVQQRETQDHVPYQLAVCADHPTVCRSGRHSDAPPFWVLCTSTSLPLSTHEHSELSSPPLFWEQNLAASSPLQKSLLRHMLERR